MSINTKTYYYENIGRVLISEKDNHLILIDVVNEDVSVGYESKLLLNAKQQLSEYFLGKRKSFQLPYNQTGTEFQLKVWQALTNIPYGQTISYKELANQIKHPNAMRAVGNANNKNQLTFIVPCHRVIGQNSKLVGYAHGLSLKQQLLDMENNNK